MRYVSPDPSSDDSDCASVYSPSPKSHTRARITPSRSVSPTLVALSDDSSSSTPSPSPKTRIGNKVKPQSKPKVKRGGAGGERRGEPRRTQNMVAQKKYRDKRVNASHLVSPTKTPLNKQANAPSDVRHYCRVPYCLEVCQEVSPLKILGQS
jgi:hypothetical protein